MKNILKTAVLLAIAVSMTVSCMKSVDQPVDQPINGRGITINATMNDVQADTKVILDRVGMLSFYPMWQPGDNLMAIVGDVNDVFKNDADFYGAELTNVNRENSYMGTFRGTFYDMPESYLGVHRLGGYFPAEAYAGLSYDYTPETDNYQWYWRIGLPAIQYPEVSNLDPRSYLLVSKPVDVDFSSQSITLDNLEFYRPMCALYFKIDGIGVGETVKKLTFCVPGTPLSGIMVVSDEGEVYRMTGDMDHYPDYPYSAYVTADYSNHPWVIGSTQMVEGEEVENYAMMSVAPATIHAGDEIRMYLTTDQYRYELLSHFASDVVLRSGHLQGIHWNLKETQRLALEGESLTKTFTAVIGEETKASVSASRAIVWDDEDQIVVYDYVDLMNTNTGKEIKRYEPVQFSMSSNSGRVATFTGELTHFQDSYFAIYPASAGMMFDSESMWIRRQVSNRQTLDADTGVDKYALTMLGEGNDELKFSPVDGMFHFKVAEGSPAISQLRFIFPGNKVFGGEMRIELPSGKTTVSGAEALSDTLDVFVGYPTHMTTFEPGKDYYISVPAGTYGPIMIEAYGRITGGPYAKLGSISTGRLSNVGAGRMVSFGTLAFTSADNKNYTVTSWKQSAIAEVQSAIMDLQGVASEINAAYSSVIARNTYLQSLISMINASGISMTSAQNKTLQNAMGFSLRDAAESIVDYLSYADNAESILDTFTSYVSSQPEIVSWEVFCAMADYKASIIKDIRERITGGEYIRLYDLAFMERMVEQIIGELERDFPGFRMISTAQWKEECYMSLAVSSEMNDRNMAEEQANVAAIQARIAEAHAMSQDPSFVATLDELAVRSEMVNASIRASREEIDAMIAASHYQVRSVAEYVSAMEFEQHKAQFMASLATLADRIEMVHQEHMTTIERLVIMLNQIINNL